MSDLFDWIQGAMGRPDPRQQLYAAMGQAPGQPGSPAGPQPLAQGGGAAPAGGAPPGGPQQQQQQAQPQVLQSPPDLAQAYQTLSGGAPAPTSPSPPPDLAQMYLAMQQRDEAHNQFYNSLALLDAAIYPGRHPEAAQRWAAGMQRDPNATMGTLVQLQQIQQQNQALQAFQRGLPEMLEKAGIDKSYLPLALADPSFMSKIAEANAGVGGGPAWMAQQRAEKALTAQGKPIPWTPGDPSSYDAWNKANTGEAVTTAKTKADDLVADQHNFAPALQNYDKTLSTIDQFMQPDMQKAAQEFLGRGGQIKIDTGALSDPAKRAYQLYKNLMATQFSAGVQDFKGAGRITQQELTQDAPSQSTMGINQSPSDFLTAVKQYREQLAQHRAQLFGPAQKATDPRLSDEDYARYVLPNQDLYGGPKRNIPDFSKMSDADADAAYDKLSAGQVYIGPDGQARRK